MKIVGAMLLAVSFIVMGLIFSGNYNRRLKELEEWVRALKYLQVEICYNLRILPEAFKEISTKLNTNVGGVFLNSSNFMLKNYLTIDDAFKKAMASYVLNSNLKSDDIKIILDFASRLGKGDILEQERSFNFAYDLFDVAIKEAQSVRVSKEKVCRSLFWGLGIALVLIFC